MTVAPRPRVVVIVGTRPELIKMFPVVGALGAAGSPFDVRLVVTAQHRDLLDPLLGLFGLRPDVDLNVMRPGQTLPQLTAALVTGVAEMLERERPAWVLVQGDTTSAMVGALSAFYAGVRVGHVEAGLRTGNMREPFPEEMNRTLIGRMATAHFAPTERARANLVAEGVRAESIHLTGNTAIDALQWALGQAPPADLPLSPHPDVRSVLVTLHRRENFGEPMAGMCAAIQDVARAHPTSVEFVLPIHPNPHVGPVVRRILGDVPNVRLTAPLDYVSTIHVLSRSYLALTDSGGIQEEAPSLGKPVLILRNTTERPEGVEAGAAWLVGTRRAEVAAALDSLLNDAARYRRMATAVNPYGDGRAAGRIVAALGGG